MHREAVLLRGGAEEIFGERGGAGSKILRAGQGDSQTRGIFGVGRAGAAIFSGGVHSWWTPPLKDGTNNYILDTAALHEVYSSLSI